MDSYPGFGRMKMDVKDYKQEIEKLLKNIEDEWILKRIYLFSLGMTKED